MYKRTHPYTIFANLWMVLYLIIIPVARGFISALQKDVIAWARGAWIDIIIFLFMITFAVLRWYVMEYACDEEGIKLKLGLFVRREMSIEWSRITTLSILEPFYLRSLRAANLRADTVGGSSRDTDISIFIPRDVAAAILDYTESENKDIINRQYTPKRRSIMALSLLTSNSLAGVVFIATFISQSGKLLGDEFSESILSTFEDLSRNLAFGIPPAAASIAYILLVGWFIGFMLLIGKYYKFAIIKKNNTLSIKCGVLTHRSYVINYKNICFLDIRQTILSKVLNLYSLYVYSVGYGKKKDDISCVIPAEKKPVFVKSRQLLFPDFQISEPLIKAPKSTFMRFIMQPTLLLASIPLVMTLLIMIIQSWKGFLLFTFLMLLAPAVMFLIIRIMGYKYGGMAKSGEHYTFSYINGFVLRTVIVPSDKIIACTLTRNLFQAYGKSGTCDVCIYTVAEKKNKHFCRSVPMKEVSALLGIKSI